MSWRRKAVLVSFVRIDWIREDRMSKTVKADLEALLKQLDTRSADRHLLQPKLHELLQKMRAAGDDVPARLEDLDRKLVEEAVEAQFDNLPL
jgi:hypothetical protein